METQLADLNKNSGGSIPWTNAARSISYSSGLSTLSASPLWPRAPGLVRSCVRNPCPPPFDWLSSAEVSSLESVLMQRVAELLQTTPTCRPEGWRWAQVPLIFSIQSRITQTSGPSWRQLDLPVCSIFMATPLRAKPFRRGGQVGRSPTKRAMRMPNLTAALTTCHCTSHHGVYTNLLVAQAGTAARPIRYRKTKSSQECRNLGHQMIDDAAQGFPSLGTTGRHGSKRTEVVLSSTVLGGRATKRHTSLLPPTTEQR